MIDVIPLALPDVKRIEPRVFRDDRGFFQMTYHETEYRDAGIDARFVQDNWSRSGRGVLRGLHYQLHHAQAKLVAVLRGSVYDLVVDIRRGSPTFGQWAGALLSEENHHQLFIPAGFAHGFCVLSDEADFVYKCSAFYRPDDEHGIRWDDPGLGIDWPGGDFIVSDKDRELPLLSEVPAAALPSWLPG